MPPNTTNWFMNISMMLVALALVFRAPDTPLSGTAAAKDLLSAQPVVIVDAGHTNKSPGAVRVTGRTEVSYNDTLVSKLTNALSKAGFVPVLTRKPNQEVTLDERTAIANSLNALAFLSIHHDSAQLVHLDPVPCNGKKTYRTRKPIAGYSLFVSGKNRQFTRSLALAELLGHELLKLGRPPSPHHAEPIPGEGRPLLDEKRGIYQYDDLAVLKNSKIPAVLLEVGVIVDQLDEAHVANTENQEAIVRALVEALTQFSAEAARNQ